MQIIGASEQRELVSLGGYCRLDWEMGKGSLGLTKEDPGSYVLPIGHGFRRYRCPIAQYAW
jgi:hypothetical protein